MTGNDYLINRVTWCSTEAKDQMLKLLTKERDKHERIRNESYSNLMKYTKHDSLLHLCDALIEILNLPDNA
jgi:hypothetical protein